jgi:hypothetical protein
LVLDLLGGRRAPLMELPAEGQLDALYTVAPARFVAERDALARQLRGEGKLELAKQAEAMRRPSASVWAVNQAARTNAARVEALLEAAARLRREQGAGDAEALREAIQAHRTALRSLVEAAEGALREAGISSEHSRAIETDLQSAAAGSREQREQLRAGRLTSDLSPTGFDALSPVAASASAPPRPQPAAPHENVAQKKREEQERLEAKRRELQERADAAEAARKLAELKRALHAAEAEAHRLEARFRTLDAKAERAEASARGARAEAEDARAELAAASERVAALQRSLDTSG